MKTPLVVILLSFCIPNILAQRQLHEGRTYKLNAPITVFKLDNNSCSTESYTICAKNKITIERIIDQKARITIESTYGQTLNDGTIICNTTGHENLQYCIDTSTLVQFIKIPDILPAYGALSVPFKFQTRDFQIYSSGNIGGFFGAQKVLNWNPFGAPSYWFLVGTVGYSRISLNNINSTDPENVKEVGAFTCGVSTGLAIGHFQVMIIKGWDNFNIEGDKQSRSWLSIGIGFGFLKTEPN